MSHREIITVDGLGASGKSSLARLLAKRLGFAHLNSGLLYRAAAYLVTEAGCNPESDADVTQLLTRHSIILRFDPNLGNEVVIDGVVKGAELESEEISKLASVVSRNPGVRTHFIDAQRVAFQPRGVVAEGRDMGTVIFPDASVKFFIEGDIGVRAERRMRQLAAKGEVVSLAHITSELAERDRRDSLRELSPTKPADGAICIDNTKGTLDEVVERMFQEVISRRPG